MNVRRLLWAGVAMSVSLIILNVPSAWSQDSTAAATGPRIPTIAVDNLQPLGIDPPEVAEITSCLSIELSRTGSFRVIERLGKSFRGAPRDAWISSLADRKKTGFSVGRI